MDAGNYRDAIRLLTDTFTYSRIIWAKGNCRTYRIIWQNTTSAACYEAMDEQEKAKEYFTPCHPRAFPRPSVALYYNDQPRTPFSIRGLPKTLWGRPTKQSGITTS